MMIKKLHVTALVALSLMVGNCGNIDCVVAKQPEMISENNFEYSYSNKTSNTTKTSSSVDAPKTVDFVVNGKKLEINWNKVTGATGYQVTLNLNGGKITNCDKNFATKTVYEGEKVTVYIRSVKKTSLKKYYSNWVEASYTVPTINLEKVTYLDAYFLDQNKLLEWAEFKGYSYETYQDENFTVVNVYYTDPLTTGLKNKATKVAGDAASAYLDGFVDEVFSVDTLFKVFTSDSVKDFAGNVVKSADEKASSDALLAGIDSAFTNTESTINYIYLYENDYNSAYASVAYFPKKGRTNYIKDSFSRFTMVSDNVYDIYTKNFSKDFYVNTREENFNGTDCWAIYSINKEDE